MAKAKAQISFAFTVKLICAFVCAYAEQLFCCFVILRDDIFETQLDLSHITRKLFYCLIYENKDTDQLCSNTDEKTFCDHSFVKVIVSLVLKYLIYLSRVVRKPDIGICDDKDADQLCSNCTTDKRLCFRYIDSKSSLLR